MEENAGAGLGGSQLRSAVNEAVNRDVNPHPPGTTPWIAPTAKPITGP